MLRGVGVVELAQGRAAGRAVADVGAQLEQRSGARAASGQLGERRCEAVALRARLDVGVDPQEAGAALGDAAVDLPLSPTLARS